MAESLEAIESSGSHASRQWKGLEWNCPPLHEILLVQEAEGSVFWDMEIFHRYIRTVTASKWLRKWNGAA